MTIQDVERIMFITLTGYYKIFSLKVMLYSNKRLNIS